MTADYGIASRIVAIGAKTSGIAWKTGEIAAKTFATGWKIAATGGTWFRRESGNAHEHQATRNNRHQASGENDPDARCRASFAAAFLRDLLHVFHRLPDECLQRRDVDIIQ
ncbi:MAG: hypothetical protein M3O61_19195, partial [Gemmatimonadota bacterium]|nr:hypothetical protein [Gemmatimonadota bacterium]